MTHDDTVNKAAGDAAGIASDTQARGGLSRRTLLRGSAALGVSASTFGLAKSASASGAPANRAPVVLRAQETNITFMGWGQPSEQEIFQSLIDSYQAAHPEVKVEYMLVPPGEFLQKLTTLAAAGDLPDVFYMDSGWFGAWAPKGVLRAIDDLIDPNVLKDMWPDALARYRFDGSTIGTGQLYALPKDLGPFVHVYNKDLYDTYGVPYPAIDGSWTWDVAFEGWKAMTKINGNTPESFGAAGMPMDPFVWSHGADFLNADRTQVTVNDPKFIEALQFVADLSCKHHVSPTTGDLSSMAAWDMWLKGMVGSFVMGPWDQPTFWTLPFQWDVSPFPSSPVTKTPANWVGSMGFAVSAESKNPEAAVALAQFFSASADGQKSIYQAGQAVPNLVSMAKGEFVSYEKAPASRQVFIDAIEKWGRPTLNWYTSDDAWIDQMGQSLDAVWSCEKTAEQWAAESAGALTESLTSAEQIPATLP